MLALYQRKQTAAPQVRNSTDSSSCRALMKNWRDIWLSTIYCEENVRLLRAWWDSEAPFPPSSSSTSLSSLLILLFSHVPVHPPLPAFPSSSSALLPPLPFLPSTPYLFILHSLPFSPSTFIPCQCSLLHPPLLSPASSLPHSSPSSSIPFPCQFIPLSLLSLPSTLLLPRVTCCSVRAAVLRVLIKIDQDFCPRLYQAM